jgi:hypothetical protein
MEVVKCVFKGNMADVYRAGMRARFRVSGCSFDGALPPAAACDSPEGTAAFATEALLVNGQLSGGRCESGALAAESGKSNASALAPASSFRDGGQGSGDAVDSEPDSRISTLACVVAALASFLSITLFLYVLFRSRAQEAGNASAPSLDAVLAAKAEFIEPAPKAPAGPVVSA